MGYTVVSPGELHQCETPLPAEHAEGTLIRCDECGQHWVRCSVPVGRIAHRAYWEQVGSPNYA